MNPLPLEYQLWTADDVAAYMQLSKTYVQEHVLSQPDAPRPVRFTRRGRARWKAKEVVEWAMEKT
ncbi:MAG: hypothetical protein LBV29_03165 [Azoarcus sp.]|jgi:predicted DNA-binding transcriptional regulator AlpA|nr:hypothetical protein [Azoarcus sp.]